MNKNPLVFNSLESVTISIGHLNFTEWAEFKRFLEKFFNVSIKFVLTNKEPSFKAKNRKKPVQNKRKKPVQNKRKK